MPQYSVSLTGPDEADLLRLYKKYGYPKPGSFLRRTLQDFVANEGRLIHGELLTTSPEATEPPPVQNKEDQRATKSSLENLDDFLKQRLSTPSTGSRKKRVLITSDNERLIFKLYVVGNYYRERGREADQNPAFVWMDILTDGRTPSAKGVEIINRDFDKKVLRSKDKERWFVKNPDMPDADQYLQDYPIDWS